MSGTRGVKIITGPSATKKSGGAKDPCKPVGAINREVKYSRWPDPPGEKRVVYGLYDKVNKSNELGKDKARRTRFGDEDSLKGNTAFLLKNPNAIKKWLTLVDKYIQDLTKQKELFTLPREHAGIQPLIEAFAFDLEGFTRYILFIRDSFDPADGGWAQAELLYRKINGRYLQKIRRERAGRACTRAEGLYGPTDYHTRLQWVTSLEHDWAQRRLAFLSKHRSERKKKTLDAETRAELLAQFWDIVDTEIHEGKGLPPWD